MTRDDIILMAREAGFTHIERKSEYLQDCIFRLVAIVSAAKAKELAEELRKMPLNDTANSIAIWIENEML